MKLDDWEEISDDEKSSLPYRPARAFKGDDEISIETDPTPSYEDAVSTAPRDASLPPRLQVIGATWGGVNVTGEVAAMADQERQTLLLNMSMLKYTLLPDPAYGLVKSMTVLYRYEDEAELRLLNVSEDALAVRVSATAHESPPEYAMAKFTTIGGAAGAWRDGPKAQVEIVAVTYGPQRIQTPAVLQELAMFFEGRRGQIRMTNSFFRTDPWVDHKKSWTIYFRFVDSKHIQCVTGMEDGALEVPWTRY
ncbi:hypothetical protein B0T25DRAFT_460978 [Lasiosphaeria hispida]|uniref:Uncharacterized protein n=1 Tax=Lasiosphaeria hispida TaxID=260671 RepID=A0AAJ0MAC7_9PEZI|nr:hypothetical protein B0T25DRAFT_460978 [Lasiosphaeria hispida]